MKEIHSTGSKARAPAKREGHNAGGEVSRPKIPQTILSSKSSTELADSENY